MKIAVWFSCGAASAVAAKMTLEKYPDADVRIVNNPIAEEDPDNRRFLCDVGAWLGEFIGSAVNTEIETISCREVWDRRQFMAGIHGAPCTLLLKKRARQLWQEREKPDYHVLGFTADEKARHDRFVLTELENVLPVLIDAGITKDDCYDILRDAGIKLPRVYDMGYPNANCIGCVKATSPTYWNHVRQMHPEVFADRAEQSRRIGAKLVRVKGKRIYLDKLDPTAKGAPLKSMPNIECGIFCEETGD